MLKYDSVWFKFQCICLLLHNDTEENDDKPEQKETGTADEKSEDREPNATITKGLEEKLDTVSCLQYNFTTMIKTGYFCIELYIQRRFMAGMLKKSVI